MQFWCNIKEKVEYALRAKKLIFYAFVNLLSGGNFSPRAANLH